MLPPVACRWRCARRSPALLRCAERSSAPSSWGPLQLAGIAGQPAEHALPLVGDERVQDLGLLSLARAADLGLQGVKDAVHLRAEQRLQVLLWDPLRTLDRVPILVELGRRQRRHVEHVRLRAHLWMQWERHAPDLHQLVYSALGI